MKIGLDVRWLGRSGIGTVIQGLLDHFTQDQLNSLVLFSRPEWKNTYPCSHVPVPYNVYGLAQHWGYGRLLNQQRLSLFHMPHFDVPLSYRGPLLVMIHDLIHILFPQYSTKPFSKIYASFLMRQAASRAQKIIVNSKYTEGDLLRFFPQAEKKTVVIYPGVGRHFKPITGSDRASTLHRYGVSPGYLLYVGNLRKSKNTPFLLSAYQELRQKRKDIPPLVLIGKNFLNPSDASLASPGVHVLGPVADRDLPALYSGASLFVFPSLYEGFGLPPLEAMACGVPVVASHVASLPEVCGLGAAYIDPLSKESLMNTLLSLLDSPQRQAELRVKGFENVKRFSWEKMAQETWGVYEFI